MSPNPKAFNSEEIKEFWEEKLGKPETKRMVLLIEFDNCRGESAKERAENALSAYGEYAVSGDILFAEWVEG